MATSGREEVDVNAETAAASFSVGAAWWGAAMVSPSGVVIEANEVFASVFGVEAGEIVGRSLTDLVGEESLAQERKVAARLVAGEGPVIEYQRRIHLPGGVPWEGVVRASLLRGPDGEPVVFHVRFAEVGVRRPPERVAWREGDFPLALDAMKVGVAILGLDGKLLQANRALCEITGRSEAELQDLDLLQVTHPDDQVLDVEQGTRAWLGEVDSYTIEKRIVRPDSSIVWVLQEITISRDEEGQPVHFVGQIIDITDRKEMEVELDRSRRQLADLVDGIPIGLLSSGPDGLIVTANRAAAEIAGLPDMPPGTDVSRLIHPDDLIPIAISMREQSRSAGMFQVEFRLVRPDGTVRWVRNEGRAELADDGTVIGIRGSWRDVTELKAAEELLHQQATRDALTGLANRHVVFSALNEGIARCEAGERGLSVLFVDLDGFKAVNDSYGHGTGDAVLVEAAARIAAVAEDADLVGRFGGDEFIVALAGAPGAPLAGVERLAGKIIEAVSEPFVSTEHRVDLGASIGIATWCPGLDADDLVNAADRAVYDAKRSGRNCWRHA